ncbi:MAG: hypothetical protein Q8P51_04990, partial [Ignavibacteria bacterium]|nr:hypothetical protein [Ignavibacteria bacterium]
QDPGDPTPGLWPTGRRIPQAQDPDLYATEHLTTLMSQFYPLKMQKTLINEKQHMDVNGRDVQLNVPTGKIIALNATSTGENDKRRGTNKPMSPVKGSLSVIIRTFKAAVTTWAHGNGYGDFAWQGRFHDHIIRNEEELHRIREYIRNNPLDWALDNENPENDPIRSK